MLKIMKALVVLVSVLTAASVLATDVKPDSSAGSSVTHITVVNGQASPSPKDGAKYQYKVRDGLTPQVILQRVKEYEDNEDINAEWLGDLDVIYGHYTSKTRTEALVISRDGSKSYADISAHFWLLGLQGGRWSILRKVGSAQLVKAQILDVNGDGLDELMISGGGGNGLQYYFGTLFSFKGNEETILYQNEGHDNWVQGFHPDYKKNILERLYTVSFTMPDAAGVRSLIEQQVLLMGKRIAKKLNEYSDPTEQFKENGNKYLITRFNLKNGVYRPSPGSAVTTKEPVKLKTVTDKSVRTS